MATKDLSTLNLKFDQVMFNSIAFTWERNVEVTFGVLAFNHKRADFLASKFWIVLHIAAFLNVMFKSWRN